MTPEQRLDRLERIAKLFVRAGQRARRQMRDQTIKIDRLVDLQNHLINLQMGNEERSAKHDEKISTLLDFQQHNEHRFERNEERLNGLSERTERSFVELAKAQALSEQKISGLAEAQTVTDHKLTELIEIIRKGRNGDSSVNNN